MSETHINEMQKVAEDLKSLRDTENTLKERRKELMKSAHNNGMTYQAIGDALGVTKAYVHQQIGKHRTEAYADAGSNVSVASNDQI